MDIRAHLGIAAASACVLCVAPSTAVGGSRSLSQQLREAAQGQPVLLVNRLSGGVSARSPDGRFTRLIVPDGSATSYDPSLELLWLSRKGSLAVLDLRLPKPTLVTVIAEGQRERSIVVLRSGRRSDPGLYLQWTRQPRVAVREMSAAFADQMSPEDMATENARMAKEAGDARIVGLEWLTKNIDRRPRPTSFRWQTFDRKVQGVPRDECRAGTCGRAARLSKPNLLFVVTEDTWDHDGAWVACELLDPKSRRWSYPLEIGGRTWSKAATTSGGGFTCGATFDASESAYLLMFSVCRIRSGCATLADESPVGWLDPGVQLVPPDAEGSR